MSIFLVGFRFALYHASSFGHSYIIIKSLVWSGICNIVVYIEQKVTVKAGGLYIVTG